ncbi:TIGR00180 family glycosyltransferase [Akkermansiaceae bacterium]|nr:TIGR00180 family glycosyltransferase [Akkermansiaceae bacterium]
MNPDITVVVPTHERQRYLRRLVAYLGMMECGFESIVVDSTGGDGWKENESTVKAAGEALKLQYMRKEIPILEKFLWAVEQVKTPYLVFCADDDFLDFEGVSACAVFLDGHPDYSCSGGATAKVRLREGGSKEVLCRGYSVSKDDAAARFGDFAKHWFSTFYFVQRTDEIRESLRLTVDSLDFAKARVYPEHFLAQLNVLGGKVHFSPTLYGIRQMHGGNYGNRPNFEDAGARGQQHCMFVQGLAKRLVETSGMGIGDAEALVARHYHHLAAGKPQRGIGERVARELSRAWRRIADRFQSDDFLERRSLGADHPFRSQRSWIAARMLIDKHPDGMDP